jgi:hypothetical protein
MDNNEDIYLEPTVELSSDDNGLALTAEPVQVVICVSGC